jgi:hypothetical protein
LSGLQPISPVSSVSGKSDTMAKRNLKNRLILDFRCFDCQSLKTKNWAGHP